MIVNINIEKVVAKEGREFCLAEISIPRANGTSLIYRELEVGKIEEFELEEEK